MGINRALTGQMVYTCPCIHCDDLRQPLKVSSQGKLFNLGLIMSLTFQQVWTEEIVQLVMRLHKF